MLDRKKEYIAEALDEIRDAYIEEALLVGEPVAETMEESMAENTAEAVEESMAENTAEAVEESMAENTAEAVEESMAENTAETEARSMEENTEEPATDSSLEKNQKKKWKHLFTSLVPVAACLVLVISLGVHFGYGRFGGYGNANTGMIGAAANPEEETSGAEMAQDINDGSADWQEESKGGSMQDMNGVSLESLLEYRSAEEILAEDIVIIRGVVEGMTSYVDGDATEGQGSHTILSVRVVDCLKGNLQAGEICQILIPVVASGYETSIAGDLSGLEIGSEAIFMPHVGEDCYYYSEGIRYLFLDTGNGVSYATDVYDIPSEGPVTLDDVEAYLREKLK